MTVPSDDAARSINSALGGVDISAPSTTKFSRLEAVIAALLDLPATAVAAATVAKPGNLSVRAEQSTRYQAARIFVALVPDPGVVEPTKRAAVDRVRRQSTRSVLILTPDGSGWRAPWGAEPDDSSLSLLLPLRAALGTEVEAVATVAQVATSPMEAALSRSLPGSVPATRLELDDRVRRMLKLTVTSRAAVMLVGPPGTGKSQLVAELLHEVALEPSRFGMTSAHEAVFVTPDESWTARELVGGDTVDDVGRIRFAPGAVLEAIAEDRWLVLDEANRADMDRIFGPLLTWLAGQPVQVGRVSPDPVSPPVRLGWAETTGSTVAGAELLRGDSAADDAVDYMAGTEWRLLGTYNALDAQRVFRFGQALGRRFGHVPVPAPEADAFIRALQGHLDGLPSPEKEVVSSAIAALYEAHQLLPAATLGPAPFFDVPPYVRAGLGAGGPVKELLAEGYLASLGTWLAILEEDQLDALGVRLGADDALGGEWEWVRREVATLR